MVVLPVGRGFLPKDDPLQHSPYGFEPVNELLSNLPDLYTSGAIRQAVRQLPLLETGHFEGPMLEAVLRDYSFLAAAYYHTRGNDCLPVTYIPSQIAVPLYRAAVKFGKPPNLSYCSYALYNWAMYDSDLGIKLPNTRILRKFTFTRDEEWFILIHIIIEALAEPLLWALVYVVEDAEREDVERLASNLFWLAERLERLTIVLNRMPEQCAPEIYHQQVRLPIMSMKQIVFEGVPELHGQPVDLLGETGAQSSIVPAVRAALEIAHQQTGMTDFLTAHRGYMPPDHRRFIADIETRAAIRRCVLKMESKVLVEAYNAALGRLYDFRARHLEIANEYIFKHMADPTGTGGTPADRWLAQLRDETAAHIISWPIPQNFR